mgnify:CR=1 FL=1
MVLTPASTAGVAGGKDLAWLLCVVQGVKRKSIAGRQSIKLEACTKQYQYREFASRSRRLLTPAFPRPTGLPQTHLSR